MSIEASLQTRLGLSFNDPLLLLSAFTHSSYVNERPEKGIGLTSNERLEFLGDAVLNFISASYLFQRFPAMSEGELTDLRTALVRTATLARFARELDLGSLIRISRGEDTPAARNRPPLLADIFEALLGAIYLDQGLDAGRAFVLPYLDQEIASIEAGGGEINYRTRLQEFTQAHFNLTPHYQTVSVSGPEHQREYTLAVYIGERLLGVGQGFSKQSAAYEAARIALDGLQQSEN
jgi:ribonuclease-3